MTQVGLLPPTASSLGRVTCVFDSDLDSEVIRAVTNHADSVLHKTILGRLPFLPKKDIRRDENNLQRCRNGILTILFHVSVSTTPGEWGGR